MTDTDALSSLGIELAVEIFWSQVYDPDDSPVKDYIGDDDRVSHLSDEEWDKVRDAFSSRYGAIVAWLDEEVKRVGSSHPASSSG